MDFLSKTAVGKLTKEELANAFLELQEKHEQALAQSEDDQSEKLKLEGELEGCQEEKKELESELEREQEENKKLNEELDLRDQQIDELCDEADKNPEGISKSTIEVGRKVYELTMPKFKHPETGEVLGVEALRKDSELVESLLKIKFAGLKEI